MSTSMLSAGVHVLVRVLVCILFCVHAHVCVLVSVHVYVSAVVGKITVTPLQRYITSYFGVTSNVFVTF